MRNVLSRPGSSASRGCVAENPSPYPLREALRPDHLAERDPAGQLGVYGLLEVGQQLEYQALRTQWVPDDVQDPVAALDCLLRALRQFVGAEQPDLDGRQKVIAGRP